MTDWNTVQYTQTVVEAVTVVIAAEIPRANAIYNQFSADARFRAVVQVNNPQDLVARLKTTPAEVLLLDATNFFSGLNEVVAALTGFGGHAYVALPLAAERKDADAVAQIDCVKGVYQAELPLARLLGQIYADAVAARSAARPADALWNAQPGGGGVRGVRIVAVWNQAGGVGKTTVSTNLAVEAARRGLATLLIGLGAPDDTALILGLRREPNINLYRSNPSQEGLKMALQKVGPLDVLVGFPDVLSEAQAISTPLSDPTAIPHLVQAAVYAGYAAIILDAPPTALASAALSAANTLALVCRPSLEGAMRAAEAYRMVAERLACEHRIPPEGIVAVLNRTGPTRMPLADWSKAASSAVGRPFPRIVAEIPDEPRVSQTQDDRRIPLEQVDNFARGIRSLADAIFSPVGAAGQAEPKKNGRRLMLPGVKVSW
ncbi:MAG TPA: AAA family ATPase [Anaerolineaceae bacterium]|nr:AAA family ATPase [Anaerolineaceae bacterium]